MIRISDLQQEFSQAISSIVGDVNASFSQVSSFERANSQSLVFAHNEKLIPSIQTTLAPIIVCSDKIKDKLTFDANKTYVFAKKSDVFVAQVLQKYFSTPANTSLVPGVHSSAIIGANTTIAKSASIGPNVVIGKNVEISESVSIGPNTFIADNVQIDENSHIDANNYIGPHTLIKKNVRLLSQNTIGTEAFCYDKTGSLRVAIAGVTLEENVEIGAGNVIERGLTNNTIIKTGTKLDNRIFIGSETQIGAHSFLTSGLRISHNVTTGHHFVCGGGTHIDANVNICDMVQVAGISCVTKDIKSPGAYGGFPLQPMKDYLRTSMTLTRLSELRKDILNFLKNEP